MIDLSCQLPISELVQASSKFQSEAKCEAIDMKASFYSHANKTRLHKKGFLHLASFWKLVLETWKWPIALPLTA